MQAAIDAAQAGDVIKIATGTYTDTHARPRDDITTTGVVTQIVYFTGQNVLKTATPSNRHAINYGDPLTYTVRLVFPQDSAAILYDPLPTYTAYISGSLNAPTNIVYDPLINAISGTLNLAAGIPTIVSFAVRVGITGTAGFGPTIINRACVYPTESGPAHCDTVRHSTYIWPAYLPLVLQ